MVIESAIKCTKTNTGFLGAEIAVVVVCWIERSPRIQKGVGSNPLRVSIFGKSKIYGNDIFIIYSRLFFREKNVPKNDNSLFFLPIFSNKQIFIAYKPNFYKPKFQ